MNRREFLKGTVWMGAAVAAAGCVSAGRELADAAGAMPMSVPDFTCGAWKTNPPAPLATFDPKVINLDGYRAKRNDAQMNI